MKSQAYRNNTKGFYPWSSTQISLAHFCRDFWGPGWPSNMKQIVGVRNLLKSKIYNFVPLNLGSTESCWLLEYLQAIILIFLVQNIWTFINDNLLTTLLSKASTFLGTFFFRVMLNTFSMPWLCFLLLIFTVDLSQRSLQYWYPTLNVSCFESFSAKVISPQHSIRCLKK